MNYGRFTITSGGESTIWNMQMIQTLSLQRQNVNKYGGKMVYPTPFMAVVDGHAQNDMCGDEKDSWKSIFGQNGFEVECVVKGIAENPKIVNLRIENIKPAHSHFK